MLCSKQVEYYKRNYPCGTRVELIHMDDKYSPEEGTRGTVKFVDGIGQIHVNWDSGSSLALVPEVDKWRVI